MLKVIIAGGGTGGHIYPALAIAQGIKERWPDAEILFLGAESGMESRIVTDAGYDFKGIKARGWQGRKLKTLITALRSAHEGKVATEKIIGEFGPYCIIGTGGYVSLPVALGARARGIPLYIHEQNAYPGLANRVAALWAKKILLTFAEAKEYLPPGAGKKTVVTGLPVRKNLAEGSKEEALAFFNLKADKKTILVTGGSQGAKSLNQAMVYVLKSFYQKPEFQLILATGNQDYQEITGELAKANILFDRDDNDSNVRVVPYIDRMDLAYQLADVFVGRAGASTLAEITLQGLPAILVPYPYASANHQSFNANSLAAKGAAIVLADKNLRGPFLAERLKELLKDEEKIKHMAAASLRAGHKNALDDIVDILAKDVETKG